VRIDIDINEAAMILASINQAEHLCREVGRVKAEAREHADKLKALRESIEQQTGIGSLNRVPA
jgi:hypothetical protein